ncbi:MAG TPA: histidine kinase [Flavobacteriales bacterium]|nr:histidine kinase [Flavobacteriales bacterium]HRE96104.1 histidine kinase [Flavobacteriales bacterium]HRJ37428.1 histidine kinase [Flavobacteriales bacterium]
MLRRLNCLLWIVLWAIPISGLAQDPAFFRISSEQGLPSNEVYTVHQDKKGFIWIGSDAGLFRYDGFRFKRYKSSGQKSRALSGLTESNDGSIYAYSFSGQIFHTQGDSLVELPDWRKPLNSIAIGYLKDVGEVLWVTALDGVHAFSILKREWIYFDDYINFLGGDDYRVVASGIFHGNEFAFLMAAGLGVINQEGETSFLPVKDFKDHGVYTLSKKGDQYWIININGKGVYVSQGGRIVPFLSESLNSAINGRKMTFNKWIDDEFFIGTHSGLIIYNDRTNTFHEYFHSTPVSGVIKDREDNFWMTSLSEGVFRIPDFRNEVWRIQASSGRTIPITKINVNREFVFCSSGQGHVGVLNQATKEWKVIPMPIQADPQTLFIDVDGRAYISIMNTIYELKGEQFIPLVTTVSSCKTIFRINGGYLFGSSIGVFFLPEISDRFPLKTLSRFWTREFQLHPSRPGAYLAATDNGVLEILPQSDSFEVRTFCMEGQQVLSIQVDTTHQSLYTLTASGELVRIDQEGEQLIKKFDEADIPNKIRLQDSGIVVATAHGLITIRFGDWKSQRITRREGLVADEINGLVVVENGFWLATARGLQFIPSHAKDAISDASLYLKTLKTDEQYHDPSAFLHLDFGQSLTFFPEFSCYRFADAADYAYRILPHDTTWRFIPGNTESFTIPSLQSGEFTIELGLVYEGEMLVEKPIYIKGYVLAPFWQRWWFYLLIGLFALVVAFTLFRIRLKFIRKKQLQELNRIHLETELKLSQQTALKSQMNPHFLFNVLNSIKGFIYENDKKNASSYLSDFSVLVRHVLELSARPQIRLSEELQVIEPYIRLEAMLLDGDFSYAIHVDDSVDPDNIAIPPLIIQPYVENAFKHGLRHKQGEKRLEINVGVENNQLIIAIADNGVGRIRSGEINKDRSQHRSFGSDASRKRIALFSDGNSEQQAVEVVDRFDQEGKATGTIYILKIPLHEF